MYIGHAQPLMGEPMVAIGSDILVQDEVWKDIEGYEGLYQVSTCGNIKSLAKPRKNGNGRCYIQKEKLLKQSFTSTGYKKVELYKDGKRKSFKVHRLVAIAFIPNPDNKPEVNHIDGNKINNNIDNLEWVTSSENTIHAYETGLSPNKKELDEIRIIELYNKGTSKEEISRMFDVSNVVIARILKENGIRLRTKSEAYDKYHLDELDLNELLKTRTQKQLAEELGCSQSLISKKINNKY